MRYKTIVPLIYKEFQFSGGGANMWSQNYWMLPMDSSAYGFGSHKPLASNKPLSSKGSMTENLQPKQLILNY